MYLEGTEASPEKIKAILYIQPPAKRSSEISWAVDCTAKVYLNINQTLSAIFWNTRGQRRWMTKKWCGFKLCQLDFHSYNICSLSYSQNAKQIFTHSYNIIYSLLKYSQKPTRDLKRFPSQPKTSAETTMHNWHCITDISRIRQWQRHLTCWPDHQTTLSRDCHPNNIQAHIWTNQCCQSRTPDSRTDEEHTNS